MSLSTSYVGDLERVISIAVEAHASHVGKVERTITVEDLDYTLYRNDFCRKWYLVMKSTGKTELFNTCVDRIEAAYEYGC